MQNLILFGTGTISKVAEYYLKKEYNIIGYTVDEEYIEDAKKYIKDMPIYPFNEELKKFKTKFFLPISYVACNTLRAKKYEQAKSWGLELINYIHPTAQVSGKIGDNCMILENSIIQPYTTLGNNCIVWSLSHIGHHNTIGDHCYVTSGSVICGSCNIGRYNFIGAGALIRDNIVIGDKNIIGMGAIITKPIGNEGLYASGVDNRIELKKPIEQIRI